MRALVVAVGASWRSSSVGFSPIGRIIIRSLSFRSGFSSSRRFIGMLLILIRLDFWMARLISVMPSSGVVNVVPIFASYFPLTIGIFRFPPYVWVALFQLMLLQP